MMQNIDAYISHLQLYRSENVGPITFARLMSYFGSAEKALKKLPEMAAKGGKKQIKIYDRDKAKKEIEDVLNLGGHILLKHTDSYPELLNEVDDAPPVLFALGNLSVLNKKIISIVGARNSSTNAVRFTSKLAGDLGKSGYVVASGLARGIDTAAHHATVITGTIAVTACGLDVVYPAENEELYNQIKTSGLILSEYPCGTKPQARQFPARNRIISGLSAGTIVVEASVKSGSLITAKYALDQGREVFAVPGSPLDPRSGGANKLIKEGAKLVESAHDIIEEIEAPKLLKESNKLFEDMSFFEKVEKNINEEDIENKREIVISSLSAAPTPIDELARTCQISIPAVMTILLELELAGRLERHPGNQVVLLY